MDYEKKYKEALERARKSYVNSIEQGWTCDKAIYEEIFPELKESEDERIRKSLIELVKQSSEILSKSNQEGMVAWLEKQGETFTKKDVDDAYLKGVCDAKHELEKQSEQKSAWSEEDERYLNTTIAYLKDANEFKKTAENCINWLKSLKDKVLP